jgi:hypothetical protein
MALELIGYVSFPVPSKMADRERPTVRLLLVLESALGSTLARKGAGAANSGRVGRASSFQWFRRQRATNLACTLGVRVHLKRPARTGKSDTV